MVGVGFEGHEGVRIDGHGISPAKVHGIPKRLNVGCLGRSGGGEEGEEEALE